MIPNIKMGGMADAEPPSVEGTRYVIHFPLGCLVEQEQLGHVSDTVCERVLRAARGACWLLKASVKADFQKATLVQGKSTVDVCSRLSFRGSDGDGEEVESQRPRLPDWKAGWFRETPSVVHNWDADKVPVRGGDANLIAQSPCY